MFATSPPAEDEIGNTNDAGKVADIELQPSLNLV
jgi:hypothetical protein